MHVFTLTETISDICKSKLEEISYKMTAGENKRGGQYEWLIKKEVAVLKQMLTGSE